MAKSTSVAFIDKNKLDFFLKDSQTLFHLEIPNTILKDIELMNRDELMTLIKNFIETNKLPPGDIYLVLSDNLFFMKDFVSLSAPQQKLEIEKYLDIVPFENIGYKTIPMEKGFRLIATNKEVFEAFISAFEHSGFTITLVIPAHIVGIQFATFGLNEANYILGRLEILRQYNLIEKQETKPAVVEEPQSTTPVEQPKKTNNKTILLGGIIFLVLLGILTFMLLANPGGN